MIPIRPRRNSPTLLFVCLFACCAWAAPAAADWEGIAGKIGPEDAIAVAAPDGTPLFAKHATRKQVPASTLKILTALVAFDQLGPDYRFPTRFYRDPDSNLIIKGYGDPMLVSEEVAAIAKTLSAKIDSVGDIVIDDTHFQKPIAIPGLRSQSLQPYDAPNGALCVNFNTVFFKTENGAIVSAESQTPLLPVAKKRISSAGTDQGRILLSTSKSEISQYAGELFAHFLEKSGVAVRGEIRTGKVDPDAAEPVYRHRSKHSLREVVRGLMEYSNNFVANQLLLAAGARAYGPPATLEKGVRAADTYAQDALGIDPTIVEGSGISR
ncbi:MAG: D-alanyl-D-alanine carboxypeptidase, partial [Thermodesulfobacteriota bacterium]